jgi:hypothetical protein
MPASALLSEVAHLNAVSERLDLLADRHPPVTEALLTISETIRSAATLLEVLVATKLDGYIPT